MSCEAEIDTLATAVDNWTATTQASQAIKAQRDMLDSAALQAMWTAYWNLSVCQFGGGLPQPAPMPPMVSPNKVSDQPRLTSDRHVDVPPVMSLPVVDMIKFIDDVKMIQRNRA